MLICPPPPPPKPVCPPPPVFAPVVVQAIDFIIFFFLFRFLAESLEYLSQHLKVEGLFRKSGSVGRQKVLRVSCFL